MSLLKKISAWLYGLVPISRKLANLEIVDLVIWLAGVSILFLVLGLILIGKRRQKYKTECKELKLTIERLTKLEAQCSNQLKIKNDELKKFEKRQEELRQTVQQITSDLANEKSTREKVETENQALLTSASIQQDRYDFVLDKYEALQAKIKAEKKAKRKAKEKAKLKAEKQAEIDNKLAYEAGIRESFNEKKMPELQKLYKETFSESAFGKTKAFIVDKLTELQISAAV